MGRRRFIALCCPDKGQNIEDCIVIEVWTGLHLISLGRSEIAGGLYALSVFVFSFFLESSK